MKPRNFPERVTRRRAMAWKRKTGSFPMEFDPQMLLAPTDIRFRLGSAKRMKSPLKFRDAVSAYPQIPESLRGAWQRRIGRAS